MIDIDGKHEWRDCVDVPGVRLPRGYYFGTSSVTGDLSGIGSPVPSARLHRDEVLWDQRPPFLAAQQAVTQCRGTWCLLEPKMFPPEQGGVGLQEPLGCLGPSHMASLCLGACLQLGTVPTCPPVPTDNHDIISLKLYQLTVERTPEEEKWDREVFLPVVDNMKLPGCE